MSWICSSVETNNQAYSPQMYYEYRSIDPKTRQIHVEWCSVNGQDYDKFKDWRRVKVESVDIKRLNKLLKENKLHFLDPHFPHNNTVLSKDHFKEQIEWVRVKEMIENAVYSKEQTMEMLQKVKLNRVEFQKALLLIARSSQTLYKQLLAKILNSEGIYEFKLFRNGLIRNIVIDDYIPVHHGHPIFVGPVRQNEVYAMLLEKALAKACGSYENIPSQCEQIMEMIFCGPVKRVVIDEVKQGLGETIDRSIKKKHLSVLISKKESRLKNYGLNQNQIYNLLNSRQICVDNTPEVVYELMSESKLSAWNGRFALNHQVWQLIELSKRMEYYQQIKNNKSFFISEADVTRHFEELLIFESLDMKNKEWIENTSDNHFPSFTHFEVPKQDHLFIRTTASSKIRQCLILVRELSPKVYEFVSSSFGESTRKAEMSVQLAKGRYILGVYHEWFLQTTGSYYVFVSSEQHVNLRKGGVVDSEFLTKSLMSYEEELTKTDKNESKLYSMRLKVYQLGLAWLLLKPQEAKNKSLNVTIDQDKLKDDNWQVLEPYKEVNLVNVSSQTGGQRRLIILRKSQILGDKKQYFPVGAFALKQ